ncbi:MAG: MoxR family ATPase [Spirochaetales bacterium]|nr:MoxR family ATPase [Spirochaetales bacterium]
MSSIQETSTAGIQAIPREVDILQSNILKVIFMDRIKLEYLLASKIAGGHVILADSHGVGKTSLARALAGSIEWDRSSVSKEGIAIEAFSRVQCTVDLLPQDIIGYTRILGHSGELAFNKGPIFAHFVLCDEINLLTPKTQGSFFQAMEEQSVSIEGKTYSLPSPFFIIATMNLKGAHLFPLPAPQLDRFMLQLSMGFPDHDNEKEIVKQHGRADGWKSFGPVIPYSTLLKWQEMVDSVTIHDDVVDYIVALVRATRNHPDIVVGASPRTGVKLSRLARALCLLRGSDFVTPDIIKEIFISAVAHRLQLQDPEDSAADILKGILTSVPVDGRKRSKD